MLSTEITIPHKEIGRITFTATKVFRLSISTFSGLHGFERWCPSPHQRALWAISELAQSIITHLVQGTPSYFFLSLVPFNDLSGEIQKNCYCGT
jgi:hypothetical protein